MTRTIALALLVLAARTEAAPLTVCAATPDLGSLVEAVGGDDVRLTVFAKGSEDPHYIEARPSFVKAASDADLLVVTGLDLDVGWLPAVLQQANNPRILPGAPGHLVAATAIVPLEVPGGTVDRSMGDVHAYGNPHYLLDPLNGLRVAALLRDRLGALRRERRGAFQQRYDDFRQQLGVALLGEALARTYDFEKLAQLADYDRLDRFLEEQGAAALVGGWLGAMRPHRGARAVDDHAMWPYFARRFGLDIVGHMEPRPGIPPTTKHLAQLVELMRAQQVRLIMASAYYDPRHARFLAEQTGARIAFLANQVGARPGADAYLSMIDYNVRQVVAALGRGA